MPRLTSSQFMAALPAAVRPHLPPALQKFRSVHRSWLCQLYYTDPRLHYEVWNLGERRNRLEIGLHFESRDRALNAALLRGFSARMVAVKAILGPQWEAEHWDKGWTKVYETVPYEPFSTEVLDAVARRLARAITVLQPLWEEIQRRLGK
ncbi:MAG: hypothetical protein NZM11_03410 [Anaerolineales bacterium]|nr:hypothetical protein [Anaerolineales bacterium]